MSCSDAAFPSQEARGQGAKSSFTHIQRKQASPEGRSLEPESLDPEYAQGMRSRSDSGVSHQKREAAKAALMKKLEDKDYGGPSLDRSRYMALRDIPIQGNPRQTEEYRRLCKEAVGDGDEPDKGRYAYLRAEGFPIVRQVFSRGPGCLWLPGTASSRGKPLYEATSLGRTERTLNG